MSAALAGRLRAQGIERLVIGRLTTDYCVVNTVKDALAQGFKVALLIQAIRAVDLHAGDGETAINEMIGRGAKPLRLAEIEACEADNATRATCPQTMVST